MAQGCGSARVAAGAAGLLWLTVAGCRPTPLTASIDANDGGSQGGRPPSSDAGTTIGDATVPPGGSDAVSAQPSDAGAGDTLEPKTPPLALASACDVQLDPPRPDIVPGTLRAAGPYRTCAALGGQIFSNIQMSADGRRLAAIGVLGEVVVLDSATLAIRGSFARARGPFSAVALSANGVFLAAGNERDGELDVFRVDDHTLIRAVELGEAYSVFGGAVALTADGARAAATVGPNVAVVDVATGAIKRYTGGERCCSNALFFVDGARKLTTARYGFDPTGTGSPAVTLLDLATGALAKLVEKGDIYGPTTLVVSADGSTIVTARSADLTVWDAATGTPRPVASTLQTTAGFDLLGVDARGSVVGIAPVYSTTRHVQLVRIADGTTVDETLLDPQLTPAAWSLDSGVLIVTGWGGDYGHTIGSLDVGARRALARACSGPSGYVESFATAAPRVLASIGAALRVFDAVSGQPVGPMLAAGEPTNTSAISPDGRRVVWSDGQPQQTGIRIADAVTGEERLLGTAQDFCAALTVSPDESWVAAQGAQGELTIFDAVGATTVAKLGAGSASGVLVGFSADGSSIRSEQNGAVHFLDWRKGSTTLEEIIPSSEVLSMSADGSTIVSTSDASTDVVYVRGTLTHVLPQGDGDGCFVGRQPSAAVSADGAWAAITTGCSRPWEPVVPPHVDLYDLGSGALIQSFQTASLLVSSDGSVVADGAALWCR